MSLRKLKFTASMIRTTLIFFFTGWLLIFRLLPITVIRGSNCISPITGANLTCLDNSTFELISWGLVILLIIWELAVKKEFNEYFRRWKSLWPIVPLILLTVISSTWSIAPHISFYQSSILLAASIASVFLVFKKDLYGFVYLLTIYFALVIALCYLLVFLLPYYGIMEAKPYYGAWRGIFWHRNYLGSFMAFASFVYLFNLFFRKRKTRVSFFLNLGGLAAAIGLVAGSRSGAGILTLVLLMALAGLIFIWTLLRSRLKKWHYLVFSIFCTAMIILVLTNLDFVFGLVGRNTSLTGRLPLWDYLFKQYISNHLWFGHGYGAIWTFEQFRVGLQNYLGWGYPVVIGDNGLIDILLHLGLTGSILMIFILGYTLWISIKYALHEKTGIAFFPLISIIFVLVSNISLSMLIELEFFTWSLLIMILLICSKPKFPSSIREIEK
jgi:exopolysaccharide production protein ExoQ